MNNDNIQEKNNIPELQSPFEQLREVDANGNEYFANRVFFKIFNKLGYSDVLYSAFDCINKYAPLRDNYFARAVYTL